MSTYMTLEEYTATLKVEVSDVYFNNDKWASYV